MITTSILNNYYYQRKDFQLYFFYDYVKVISCMKYSIRQKGDFLFNKHHSNLLSKVQQTFSILECNTLVAFVSPLSINKHVEDTIT